ncbi:phage major capsid protein [Pseudoroseicyclus aestuarii]|uniref:HK97 family phage major capsid protein n=1 Tax=Pseudoroseicyclus aestuarii TaxID=1795041 RepID=A0A318T3G0_9RHOB|nr:phage major capsid protein [Pseudoroseicyclus aestuarii]PYE80821.1 HK97 family phage major capsid protein [Pseudoroseicyclus aestuarii]
MKDLNDLRRDRKAAADKMQSTAAMVGTLEAAETIDQAALDAAVADFEAAQTAFASADGAVKRAEAVEAAQAAAATSGDQGAGIAGGTGGRASASGGATVPATASNPEHRGVAAALMVQALASSRGNHDEAVRRLETAGHSGLSAALSGASTDAGGVTIPRAQSAELIEMLRPRVAVMNAGARMVPMPAGQLRHASQQTSATASYGEENAPIRESEPTFGSSDMSFKKLTSLVPIGNSLLRHSSASMGQLVRDDILKVMGLRRDLAFLRGTGANNTPIGLRTWTPASAWMPAVGNTAPAVEMAVRGLVSRVEDADVQMTRPGWIMRAGTKNFLASLRDPASGAYLFPSISQNGTLLGFPIYTTSQIPDNLGGEGDETEVYFADFDEVMIGDTMEITVSSSTEASFVDVNGDTVSAYQRDLTLVRAISEHDMAPRHDAGLAGLNGKGWTL